MALDDVEFKAVIVSLASAFFLVSVLGVLNHLSATFTFGGATYALADVMGIGGGAALALGALYGDRSADSAEWYEIGAVLVALFVLASSDMVLGGTELVSAIMEPIENYRPWGTAALGLVSYYGYWAVTFGGN
jgi:hypothetical protein